MERLTFTDALQASGILEWLAPFDPHVAGTPPLGLDMPGSDIDILCEVKDERAYTSLIWQRLGTQQDFLLWQWRGGERAIIASFTAHGWPFEIFASTKPVEQQAGWRHFRVEQRLLDLGGEAVRSRIVALRQAGIKTEPAFASALSLTADPYAALLELYDKPDAALLTRLEQQAREK